MGLEMSYIFGSTKILHLLDFSTITIVEFAGTSTSTERARIPCISVHNTCSEFPLSAGNYAV